MNGAAGLRVVVRDNSTGAASEPVEVTRAGVRDAAGRLADLMVPANAADVEHELTKALADVADKFVFHSAAEFDALDLRREYHVPGILAAGPVPTVAAGSFKTLKTSVTV